MPTVGLRHEVDALGGATHKDDFLAAGGIDKVLHLFARLLVGIGGTGGQRMGTTVDIGVVGTVILADLIDHLVGLLRGGTIVEPHQIVTVHLLLQHGEVALHLVGIERVNLVVVQTGELALTKGAHP